MALQVSAIEEYLINDAQRGDLEAFNQLVLIYQDRVYHLAYHLLGDVQAADDVTQEVFLAAFLKLNQFRGGSFRSWILRVATNRCYDALRYRQRHPTLSLESSGEKPDESFEYRPWLAASGQDPEELAERVDFHKTLRECLQELPANLRLALVLVDIQGLNYSEAATAMKTSLGTLKSRLVRGRQKMTAALNSVGDCSEDQSARSSQPGGRTAPWKP